MKRKKTAWLAGCIRRKKSLRLLLCLLALPLLLIHTKVQAEKMVCIVPEYQYVRIRNGEGRNAAEMGRMHTGDQIDAECFEDGFVRFRYEGRTAFADAAFFETPEDRMYRVIANGRVAKRDKPGGRRTGWLNPEIQIQVLGWRYDRDGIRWARVYGGCFVKAEFLSLESK